MPVSLAQIATNTANVEIRLNDSDTVNLTYYPGRVTEKMFANLQAIPTLNENTIVSGFGTLNETLANLIADWDLYEDLEMTKKFPIDASRFPDLPITFRMQLIWGIMGDIRPEALAPQTQTPN